MNTRNSWCGSVVDCLAAIGLAAFALFATGAAFAQEPATDPLDAFPRAPAPEGHAAEKAGDPLLTFPPAPAPVTTPAPLVTQPPRQEPTPPPSAATLVVADTPEPPAVVDSPSLPWRIGLVLGLGYTFPGSLDPLGLGLGARVDYRPWPREDWVFGARFLYYFGESQNLSAGLYDTNAWLVAADVAYVLNFDPIWLEPGLALGLQTRAFDGPTALGTLGGGVISSRQSGTQLGFYVAPLLRAVVPFAVISTELRQFYAACDLQLGMVLGERARGQLEFVLQAGMRF
ncbi:MAG: hypothetical protein RL701_864 [Pseudomonadota bacterium]